MLSLVQGSVENVNVTITDPTGELTTLDSASPTYTVSPVDPDTDTEYRADQYINQSALNASMMIQALIDTTVSQIYSEVLADHPALLPLSIVTGVNDTFRWNGTNFTIAEGTYTTYEELVSALSQANDGSNTLSGPTYGIYVSTLDNKLRFQLTSVSGAPDGFNGDTVNLGSSHDVLLNLGFLDGQMVTNGQANANVPWNKGKYNLYVGFAFGSEIPKLGPVELFII